MTQGKHSINNVEGPKGEAAAKRNPLLTVLKVAIFLVLALVIFIYCNLAIGFGGSKQDKGTYKAFYDLQDDTVDAVIIGASSVSRYYIAPKAYVDYGISSFVIGPASTPVIFADNIMKLTAEKQDPKVYVVELRNILKGYGAVNEAAIRRTTDSLPLTEKERYEMIDEGLKTLRKHAKKGSYDDSRIDYLFPIVKYGSRMVEPDSKDRVTADELMLNGPYNTTQGFHFSSPTVTQASQNVPTFYSETGELDDDTKEILDGVLEYCDTIDTPVLFTFSPLCATEEDQLTMNAVTEYVESRGYDCLNFNSEKMSDAVGLDYSTDFYNNHHVNYLGAEKYTKYLSEYLIDHYDLPDHRGDSTYAAWEEGYEDYEDYVSDGIKHVSDSNVADEG